MLEVLDLTLVLLSRLPGVKSTQVFALVCLRIYLAAIDAVLAGFQFAYHQWLI